MATVAQAVGAGWAGGQGVDIDKGWSACITRTALHVERTHGIQQQQPIQKQRRAQKKSATKGRKTGEEKRDKSDVTMLEAGKKKTWLTIQYRDRTGRLAPPADSETFLRRLQPRCTRSKQQKPLNVSQTSFLGGREGGGEV